MKEFLLRAWPCGQQQMMVPRGSPGSYSFAGSRH